MLEITDRAYVELQRLGREHLASPRQAVRLHTDMAGGLAMSIDAPHPGDSVFRREHAVLLIVEGRLSHSLAERVLDFPAPMDRGSKGEFTLHRRTPEPPQRAAAGSP
jgi:hypothetical protein